MDEEDNLDNYVVDDETDEEDNLDDYDYDYRRAHVREESLRRKGMGEQNSKT